MKVTKILSETLLEIYAECERKIKMTSRVLCRNFICRISLFCADKHILEYVNSLLSRYMDKRFRVYVLYEQKLEGFRNKATGQKEDKNMQPKKISLFYTRNFELLKAKKSIKIEATNILRCFEFLVKTYSIEFLFFE